jgi:hypothetical protein
MRQTCLAVLLATILLAAILAAIEGVALAYEDNLGLERTLSEILQDKRLKEAKQRADVSKRDVSEQPPAEEQEEEKAATEEGKTEDGKTEDGKTEEGKTEEGKTEAGKTEEGGKTEPPAKSEGKKPGRRAIVPDIGYSPETGPKGGAKFTDRDLQGLTLDVSASIAQKGQQHGRFSVVAPDLLSGWLIVFAGADYKTDPTVEFFGLGNNEVGPDELSTNGYARVNGRLALAVRFERRLMAVVSGEYNDVKIYRGDSEKQHGVRVPSTVDAFPTLVGINGGNTSPLSVALIFDDRDEVTRPIQGWNAIAKYQRIDRSLGNRFQFNRYILEASYLYPLFTGRQVIGVRAGGEYIDSSRRGTPFFEFSSLGGGEDMRGYFQNRFLGKSKFIVGGEYRLRLFNFDFFNFWNVKVDGVGFVDVARVFLERDELAAAFGQPASTLPKTNDKLRVSYGPGVRFALGEAFVARIDAGFSSEETGRTYVTFGHTF